MTYSGLMWEGTATCTWCYSYSGGSEFHEKVAWRSYKELSSKQCSSKALLQFLPPVPPLNFCPYFPLQRHVTWEFYIEINSILPSCFQSWCIIIVIENLTKTVEILLNLILVILWSSLICWLQFYKAVHCLLSLLSHRFHLPFCS